MYCSEDLEELIQPSTTDDQIQSITTTKSITSTESKQLITSTTEELSLMTTLKSNVMSTQTITKIDNTVGGDSDDTKKSLNIGIESIVSLMLLIFIFVESFFE